MAVTTESFLEVAVARRAAASPLSGVLGILGTLRLWRQRSIERAMLARMTYRDIADLGMTEADVLYEMDKPFWRA